MTAKLKYWNYSPICTRSFSIDGLQPFDESRYNKSIPHEQNYYLNPKVRPQKKVNIPFKQTNNKLEIKYV